MTVRSVVSEFLGARNKIRHGLTALSSAAILTVYAAGYERTREAADRFSDAPAVRPFTMPLSMSAAPAADSSVVSPALGASARPRVPAGIGPREETGARPTAEERIRAGAPRSRRSPTMATRTDADAGLIPLLQPPAAPAPSPNAGSTATAAPSQPMQSSTPVPSTSASQSAAVAVVPAPVAPAPVATAAFPPPAAVASAPPVQAAPAIQAPPVYKTGKYTGWGTCRHGDIQAEVQIVRGMIVDVKITQCLTRYSCDYIADLPGQVIDRQSPNVDYVAGATQSVNAFFYAVVEALSKAK